MHTWKKSSTRIAQLLCVRFSLPFAQAIGGAFNLGAGLASRLAVTAPDTTVSFAVSTLLDAAHRSS